MTYNRIEHTKKVLSIISIIKPSIVYVASDGPKNNDDYIKIKTIRLLVDNLLKDVVVKKLYHKKNKGCKLGCQAAINWFFDNEKKGIILEDDTLPSRSFFKYCQVLLKKYEYDHRVWFISGNNFFSKETTTKSDYFFSRYGSVWGWATWSDRWKFQKKLPKLWINLNKDDLKIIYPNQIERKFRKKVMNNVLNGKLDTWDYEFIFTANINNAVVAIPKVNLVTNIGFGEDATHTKSEDPYLPKKTFEIIGPISHPDIICSNVFYDSLYIKRFKKITIEKLISLIIRIFKQIWAKK